MGIRDGKRRELLEGLGVHPPLSHISSQEIAVGAFLSAQTAIPEGDLGR